jgi:transglutaminase-like putative cysteine protease
VRDAAIRMARKWAKRPQFRPVALGFLMPWAPPSATQGEQGEWVLNAAQNYAINGWRFVREPAGIEHAGEIILSPCITIRLNAGDCDDFASMMSAVFKSIGVRCRIGWMTTGPGGAHILFAAQAGWYVDPGSPYFVVDPNLKNPVDAVSMTNVHWANV